MLVGRRGVVARVGEWSSLVNARGVRELQRTPIIQLVGPPHCGKTELLVALARQYGDVVPVAWLDFAHVPEELQAHQILKLLIFELSRPVRGPTGGGWLASGSKGAHFGQLEFPCLLGALIAVERELPDIRTEAVREIQLALEDPASIERIKNFVTAFAKEATNLLQVLPGKDPPGTAVINAYAPDIILATLRRTRWGRKRVSPLVELGLRPWPGMISGSLPEALVDINFYMKSQDPLVRDLGAGQPWAAFLEDLRHGYEGSAGRGRNLCCVLVLDNIDCPKGEMFVRALAKARARRSEAGGGADPLLVVSAGRHSVNWTGDASAIETIRLPDLSLAEIQEIAVPLAVPAAAAASGAVLALTAGHKGAAKDLLLTCSRQASYPYDLLEQPVDADDPLKPANMAKYLRECVLPGITDSEYEVLVTCSPAMDIGQAQQAAREGRFGRPELDLHDRLNKLGWLRTEEGGTSSRVHPLIRNLLLHELSRRAKGHDWPWIRACLWFRDHPPARFAGLTSATLANDAYYDLAIGNVAAAIDALESIRKAAAGQWLGAFDWVITAPHAYGVRHDPCTLAVRLVRATDRSARAPAASQSNSMRRDLAGLIVACWLASDRQLDPWHDLDQMIAHGYEAVAPLVEGEEFYQRAQQYRDSAQWWSRVNQNKHPRPLLQQE